MGAGVSACQYSEENLPKVTAFAEKVTESAKTLPSKDDAKGGAQFNPAAEEAAAVAVPQKYIWIQGICYPFVLYTDMGGKTLPELWDEIAGAGFTEHVAENIQKISAQVVMATLAPEIKALIESDIDQDSDEGKPQWDAAIATVLHRNVAAAKAKSNDENATNPLAGTPDAALEIDAAVWNSIVYTPPVETYPLTAGDVVPVAKTENPVAAEDEEGAQAAKKQKTEEGDGAAAEAADAPVEEVASAEVVATAETTSDESPVTAFCKASTKNCTYMPSKEEAKDTGFSAPSDAANEPVNVPQKYIWINSLCANFVQFGNMGGKTLPELWDSKFDSGFTDYGPEELHTKCAELLESILHSDVRSLVEKGIKEADEQEQWSIACGKAIYENCAQAKAAAEAGGASSEIQYALAGVPDEAFPVEESQWKKTCAYFPSSLFTEAGKFNGQSYNKSELEAILGREVADDEIEVVDEEE